MEEINSGTANNELTVKLITKEQYFDLLEDDWNKLFEVAGGHIFQTFCWQYTWWSIFGKTKQLHIVACWDNDKLVGVMPMFIDQFKLFGIDFCHRLRMLGSHVMQPTEGSLPVDLSFSSYLSPIVHPDYEQTIYKFFTEYLISYVDNVDEILLEEMPESHPVCSGLSGMRNLNFYVKEASVCPLIQLPDSWDELLKDLSSNARYQIRRDLRNITDENLFKVKTASQEVEINEIFDKLVEFHQDRWQSLGQTGLFADERILEFYREVVIRLSQKDRSLLKYLEAEEKCVAVDLLFKCNDALYLSQRGFDASSTYSQYGPGNILLYWIVKEAIEDNIKTYEFLRGEERYKQRLANKKMQNKELRLQSGDFQTIKCQLIRDYVAFCRKIKREWYVLRMYFEQGSVFSAIRLYFDNIYHRYRSKLSFS